MTNDPYRHLRIALAEGKCVTDTLNREVIWEIGSNKFVYWNRLSLSWAALPVDSYHLTFNANSSIVPDPSLTKGSIEAQKACISHGDHQYKVVCESRGEAECITCGAKLDKKFVLANPPQSLSYEQALAAKRVRVDWNDGDRSIFEREPSGHCYQNMLIFDLAERRNYRMEAIND